MAYQQKDMSGSLFKNKKKRGPKDPDSTGSMTVDGVEYWLSGWTNETKDHEKYVAFKIRPKDDQQSSGRSVDDDDIPF